MFLGIIFVDKHPVLFEACDVHDNFCRDCLKLSHILK